MAFGNIIKKLFGTKSEKDIKSIQPIVDQINDVYAGLSNISIDSLRAKTEGFRKKIEDYVLEERNKIKELKQQAEDETDYNKKDQYFIDIDELEGQITEKLELVLEEILPEAYAVVRETARRFTNNEILRVNASAYDQELAVTKNYVKIEGEKAIWSNTWEAAGAEIKWDMVHYDVQLIGGIVMHQGKIAEMATGEGKTLVATLPMYLNALTGRGVHLVTVNDYLAKRDSEWMAPIFEFHGLSVDCIDKHRPNSAERIKAYRADITYGTNNEFGFDYLRDNMASQVDHLVQRKLNYAIVDEIDSVLIDDARTPLIISGPTPKGDQHEFDEYKLKVERLVRKQREYITAVLADAKKYLKLEPEGMAKKEYDKKSQEGAIALLRAYRGLPKNKALIKFLSEPGIKSSLQKVENRYLQDNKKDMPFIDEELYFVIDEQVNSIELTEKGIDLITGNTDDPAFFVVPDIGSTIADIEKLEVSEEDKMNKKNQLMQDYSTKIERIHTINQLLKAYTLFEKDVEYVVMENKVKIVDEQTGRIMDGRRYSDGLHQAIEAKESVKVEAATQTYATVTLQNYFRMYNKLAGMTGTAETEAGEFFEIYKLDVVVIPTNKPIARDDREDLVFKTAREKYNAIIKEIESVRNDGRPVLVGTTSVETSELLSKMLKMRKIPHSVLNAKLHGQEAEVVANAGYSGTVTIATNMAGRGTDIKLKEGVKEAGGLAILGTERHESRRVDRQLRGRAGRQGDPGSSQFFVSLEDNLMRLFGSERISKMMDRLGHQEGDVIQNSMITKSIERAQKKVEENHFGRRKNLLEYDDVMNSQREVIYKKRRHALYEDRLSVDINESLFEVCNAIVTNSADKDFENFKLNLISGLSITSPIDEEEFQKISDTNLANKLFKEAYKHYTDKKNVIAKMVYEAVKDVITKHPEQSNNLPPIYFTDGAKVLGFRFNRDKLMNSQGKYIFTMLEKVVSLSIIDDSWKEHLRELDDLKQFIQGGAQFEQKDPLVTYKIESFDLFEKMIGNVNHDIISFLQRSTLYSDQQAENKPKPAETKLDNFANAQAKKDDFAEAQQNQEKVRNQQQGGQRPKPQPVTVEDKVGRNDPCPCGSGKKYKQCHGRA